MAQSWNPLQDLVVLQDRMNRLFEDATQRRAQSEADMTDEVESADWYPAADIVESEGQFVITVDLPGVDRAALDINIDDNRLMIRGTRTIERTPNQRAERPRGRFIRTFGVPSSVDQGKIRAEYKDGVLDVILPKSTENTAKRVEIKVS
jgi:HSP20 family protein